MADSASTGVLHGNTITLDKPVPPLDGQRVRVLIVPIEESSADNDVELTAAENANLLKEWASNGPQGPIEDDEEPEFP